MKKLLIALFVGVPLVGCTEKIIVKKAPAAATPEDATDADPDESTDGTESEPDATNDDEDGPAASKAPEDRCLDGQDMDAADVDVSACPEIPSIPADAPLGEAKISLGAWEIGTTADGETYKYGTLSAPGTNPRVLSYDGGSVAVNAENLECWAKGYYRLRKMLQDAPAEYVALRKAGFQYRFFQFQSDLRNGPTGYKKISSFQDHLVKWVTVINAQGVCEQPTLTKFREYAKSELTRRGIPQPGAN
ncbi:MAG: hypothetical protein KIS78_31540 [Labilithrix sp.]|nr:hypothetical protein [Labilithrix sp.]MCW5836970.1 hypothetical protein [Labilithrix sp.]